MAELTSNATQPPPDSIGGTNCKSSLKRDPCTSPPNPLKQLIFVRYLDHVLYNRHSAMAMQPQTREAVGWLVYEAENYIKAVRTFYRVNGVKIELTEPLSRRVVYKDRAPKPEEFATMMDLTDLRGKVIVSCFALGGFREETFSKLFYRHVKEDLEAGTIPIHVHVEIEITKGKYHDYDTFLGAEAAYYLKLFLDQHRKGTKKLPPENITDDSPLIRDETRRTPKSISTKQLRKIVHDLYVKAGFIKPNKTGGMYDLRTHSIRK
jgi:hypothetical protein